MTKTEFEEQCNYLDMYSQETLMRIHSELQESIDKSGQTSDGIRIFKYIEELLGQLPRS